MANKTNYSVNGTDYFRLTADYGRDASGKRIRKTFYGKNKKEAEAKKAAYEKELDKGLSIDFDKVVLGELMHTWLFEVVKPSPKIRPTTFERYEGIFRNYVKNSELYHWKLKNLKTLSFQKHYNQLYSSGKTTGQIESLNKLLKKFFFYCVDEDLIVKNPLQSKNLSIPGKEELKAGQEIEKDFIVFTDEEIARLRIVLEHRRERFLILLALSTGLRLGELLALTWEDIHDGMIHVNKSLKHARIVNADGTHSYKYMLLPAKTKASVRAVPYPSALEPEIKRHKALQAQEKLAAGPLYADGPNLIFKTPKGTATDPHNFRKTFMRILRAADIEPRKFHSLRHTYATKLFEGGVPPKTVQTLMGHSDIKITLEIYTHVMPVQKITAVEVLNQVLI